MSESPSESRTSFIFEDEPQTEDELQSKKSLESSTDNISTSKTTISQQYSNISKKSILSQASMSDFPSKEKIISQIRGNTWIDKIRNAFIEASNGKGDEVTMEQWCNSNLKYLIDDEILSEDQMVEYFSQIDANTDYHISWSELVAYLMMRQKSLIGGLTEKKLRLTYYAPDALTIKKTNRPQNCLRIRYIPAFEQLVTLTETTLTFWNKKCIPEITFSDRDKFVDFCCLSSIFKIAIAKQNRQIIFYDLRQHEKLNYFISATLDTNAISHYDPDETVNAISNCRRRRIPLFNTPTAMESDNEHPYIFIGDQEGRVEVFHVYALKSVKGGNKPEWESKRVKCMQIHTQAVTQITYIPKLEIFASSSIDGTIALWRYAFETNEYKIDSKYSEPTNLPITSFAFEPKNQDFVYLTPSHYFGIWRIGMARGQTISTNQQVISTMAICSLSADSNFCVTVTKTNFFIIYRLPNMEMCANYFMGLQHELCPPTTTLVVNDTLYLVGAFVSAWKIENGTGDGLRACQHPIVNVLINDLFKKVLTCDTKAGIASWDLLTGNKIFGFDLEEPNSDVTAFALDVNQRRTAVGYSNGIVHIVTSNSGSVLCTIEKGTLDGGCLSLCFGNLFGHPKLLCSTGKRSVVLFDDLKGNRMSFHRNFIGHSDNVVRMAILKERVIVTVGSDREMFLWSPQQQNPLIKYNLPNDPTLAIDIPNNDDLFIAADVVGFLYIMRLDSPKPVKSFNIFGMYIKSAITSVVLSKTSNHILIGNMHGYVRAMFLEIDNKELNDIKMFRAHAMSIINIAFSESEKVFITSSLDQEVKLWTLEPFSCIGSVGKLKKWILTDQTTWLGDKTVEIDETHFTKPEPPKIEEEEEIVEEPVVESTHELPPLPPFSFEAAKNMYDTSEDQYLEGNKLLNKIKLQLAQPKSARIIKPVVPKLMTLADLVERRHMENTAPYVEETRAITPPKITFPSYA